MEYTRGTACSVTKQLAFAIRGVSLVQLLQELPVRSLGHDECGTERLEFRWQPGND